MENLKLKPEKCCLAGSAVLYLGYVFSRDCILPDPAKIDAVKIFLNPWCKVIVILPWIGILL